MVMPNPVHICEARLPQQLLRELVSERGVVVAMIHYLGDEVATDGIPSLHREILLPAALIGCNSQVKIGQAQAQHATRFQHSA
jgi:hypothetical protein